MPRISERAAKNRLAILVGVVAVARYDSINEFLLPSSMWVVLMQLPVLDRVGLLESPVFWLWPTQACLVLLEGGFRTLAGGEVGVSLLSVSAWSALFAVWARRSFRRFVVQREGVR